MTQAAEKKRLVRRVRRVVVKVGSNVLASPDGLRAARVRSLATDVAELSAGGRHVVLVSSGAVAAGAGRLNPRRPGLEWRQAAAAVGQPTLMAAYA
ncbi:MAG: glutamate 5-kinase, partial [Candidatus Binatia bacterium]